MPITEEQEEQRRHFVGSSDIGAIIGVNPDRNAGDVWLDKTGRLPAIEATTDMNRGIALEPFILNMFELEFGIPLKRNIRVQGDDVCASNLDAAIMEDESVILAEEGQTHIIAPVEAKSTNMGKDWNRDVGEIPMLPLVQVSFQIFCSGPQCDHGLVPALIPEFQRFKFLSPVPIVKRNDDFIEELRIAAHEFMEYVRKDIRPPDAVPHLESLKRMRREPQSVLSLGDEAAELWEQYAEAGEREKGIKRDREELKQQILDVLGDAEGGRLPDGRTIVFPEQNGARQTDLDRLQVAHPAWYEQLEEEGIITRGRFRVLRIKKAAIGRKR